MTTPAAMTDLQLAMHLTSLPTREILWTRFDHAVRDEYDRRTLERDALRRAA